MVRIRHLFAVAGALAATVGCTAGPDEGGDRQITVAAASSLTEVFEDLTRAFESRHPGTEVTLTFGSSSALARQVSEGAPVDVFASAAPEPVEDLEAAGLVAGDPVVFATNRLTIVTPPGNPAAISGIDDLGDVDVLALCVETAPCGYLAQGVLAKAGVTPDESSVTRGQNVKATLAAVADGDADAAVVYVTDAMDAADAVTTVAIEANANAMAHYPIAALGEGDATAAEFVAFVTSPEAQAILAAAGFGPMP